MLKASRGKCWSPSSLFCRGDFFSTFDLKSGYHHVDIYQDCWDSPGVLASRGNGTCFGCCPLVCPQLAMCLPSCYNHWLQGGDLRALRCIVYIDDAICASRSEEKCISDANLIVTDLDCAGFILNDTKSKLEPHQVGLWLSFTLDLLEGRFLVRAKS